MKTPKFTLVLIPLCSLLITCQGQKPSGAGELTLQRSISLSDVKGRIDHLDVNLKDQIIYIAALGNNSLEVVDLKSGKLLYTIKGLDEPQGVVYIPQTNEIMIANGGNGQIKFYNAKTFASTVTLDLGSDADDVRYDSVDQKIYVGYGEGGIAIIDALKHQKITDIKLSGHPEGFQLDKQSNKLFVNVPDANQIDVIDLQESKLTENWKTDYRSNFPMALDTADHVIFIGYRHPAKLVSINATTGKTIAVADLISDIDDLYFDNRSKKIYASGGGGAINVFYFNNSKIIQLASIPTRSGARTSLLIPSLNAFALAEGANSQPAQLQVYNIKN